MVQLYKIPRGLNSPRRALVATVAWAWSASDLTGTDWQFNGSATKPKAKLLLNVVIF